jgi:hypothetical protein
VLNAQTPGYDRGTFLFCRDTIRPGSRRFNRIPGYAGSYPARSSIVTSVCLSTPPSMGLFDSRLPPSKTHPDGEIEFQSPSMGLFDSRCICQQACSDRLVTKFQSPSMGLFDSRRKANQATSDGGKSFNPLQWGFLIPGFSVTATGTMPMAFQSPSMGLFDSRHRPHGRGRRRR